jgi:imidazole glycerol-phosphate synthase subunit HisH
MQLLFDGAKRGRGPGIGLVAGQVRRLRTRIVPQMGWNDVEARRDDPLFEGLGIGAEILGQEFTGLTAYYANSFICEPEDPEVVIARSTYEEETFAAAVRRGRTWGVQFHPEKSSAGGLRLLRNFLDAGGLVSAGSRAAGASPPFPPWT